MFCWVPLLNQKLQSLHIHKGKVTGQHQPSGFWICFVGTHDPIKRPFICVLIHNRGKFLWNRPQLLLLDSQKHLFANLVQKLVNIVPLRHAVIRQRPLVMSHPRTGTTRQYQTKKLGRITGG